IGLAGEETVRVLMGELLQLGRWLGGGGGRHLRLRAGAALRDKEPSAPGAYPPLLLGVFDGGKGVGGAGAAAAVGARARPGGRAVGGGRWGPLARWRS